MEAPQVVATFINQQKKYGMTSYKRQLRVRIKTPSTCPKCAPIGISVDDPNEYGSQFQTACTCLTSLESFPSLENMAKIELLYAVYILNGKKMLPNLFYYGLNKGLNLSVEYFYNVITHSPFSVSNNFLDIMEFTIEYSVLKDEKRFFFVKNDSYSCLRSFTDIVSHADEELLNKIYSYTKRVKGIDSNHSAVGMKVKLLVPNIEKYKNFMQALEEYRAHFFQYQHPNIPKYFLLVEATYWESKLDCKLSLMDCILDTWIIKMHGERIHEPFFFSSKDFENLNENKGGVYRKSFSKIINTEDRKNKFKQFALRKQKSNPRWFHTFCIPESGYIFEEFLEEAHISVGSQNFCVTL